MRVNPRDYISKSTRAIPADKEDCPLFKKFLAETVPLDPFGAPDKATLVFLQQWFGYCLTGLTKEQVFLFIYGPGGNGKSVLMDTIGWVLGDYFVRPTDGLYLQSGGGRHLQEVAMLAGARMAAVPDVPANARWNEARLKDHTGGGLVTANFMRQNSFSFEPQFKLVVSGNHKPTFPGGMTAAVKRRFKLLLLDRRPKVVDKGLVLKLRGEGPGILRWMIQGLCDPTLGYLKVGLMVPGTVDRATDAYFDSQDDFGTWLGGDIEAKTGGVLGATEALGSWRGWAAANGISPDLYSNPSTFAEEMGSRGFTTVKNRLGRKEYRDIVLKTHTKSVFD
jgi:putative DNA primase/helicase